MKRHKCTYCGRRFDSCIGGTPCPFKGCSSRFDPNAAKHNCQLCPGARNERKATTYAAA